jgi:hypothetical protein
MGRYPKNMPEEEKLRRIKENRRLRNIRYRYIYHGNYLNYIEKLKKREKTKQARLERRKPKDELYRMQHRHYYRTKSRQYRRILLRKPSKRGLAKHNLEKYSFNRLVYTANKLGIPLSEDFLKVATKKDLIELIQNHQISTKRIEKEKEEKEKEESRPKTLEEEYRNWQYWAIAIIFFGSLVLAVLSMRYGLNLFSLFSQTF